MAGILPQRQVAGEQGGRDDEAEGRRDPDPDMNDAALGQRHHRKHGGGVKQQHR